MTITRTLRSSKYLWTKDIESGTIFWIGGDDSQFTESSQLYLKTTQGYINLPTGHPATIADGWYAFPLRVTMSVEEI